MILIFNFLRWRNKKHNIIVYYYEPVIFNLSKAVTLNYWKKLSVKDYKNLNCILQTPLY